MNTVPISNRCPKCAAPLPEDAPQGLCPKCLMLAASAPTESDTGPADLTNGVSLEAVQAAFPQLEILELIGAGGMGAVYKARQPKLDRFVALKVLSPSLAASPAFAERFNREARVLARLNHPGIVSIFDFGVASAQPSTLNAQPLYFLLMEYVDGVNLRQAMEAGRFTPTQALALVPKICEALQFAHDEGILHRDIKPENILLDTKGRVKIADFGIAKLVGEPRPVTKLTATGAAIGTPNYMAPEQLEHPEDVDQRADIYSLGVVFYEMLTGELPIGRFAPPSEKAPVDPRVDAVVFRALEKERERRYASAGEVKTSVEHLTSAPPTPPAAPATLAGAPAFDPAKDFILCPPQLPRMAQAIIIYALTVAPVLWLLSLFSLESLPDHPLVGFVQAMVNLVTGGLEFVLTMLLAIGGWKLRGLRCSAVNWLRTIIWLRIGCGLVAIVGAVWVEALASQFIPDAPVSRPQLADGLMIALGLAAMVFEISALVWLRRHRVALRALCTKGQPPSDAPPSYWQQAWLSWPAGARFGVKAGIIATIIGLGWLFAYYRIEWVHEGPYVVRNSVVGWPTPWLSWWRSPLQNSELDWGFEFFTLSFAAGLGAMALVILLLRLRSTERRWSAAFSQPPSTAASRPAEAGPRWSRASIVGAVLVGLSMVVPVLLFLLASGGDARGGLGLRELVLFLGIAALLALPGTILGWIGLSNIRVSAGRLLGLPLAVFAALAWPLGLLIGVTVVVPAMIAIPVTAGEGPPLWTRFMVLVPAGVITFAIWAVYATARWGGNRPPSARRGVLKWIFLGLLLALMGLTLLHLMAPSRSTAPMPVSRVQGEVESPGGRDERAVILTVSAPPREYLVVSATVLSNRVLIAQRNLRTKLWPPSSTQPTDFQVKWEPVVTEGALSWDIEVTSPHDGSVQARLCPENLPQFRWSAALDTPRSVRAGREAREIEVARALRRLPQGTEDWSVRLKLQSQPSPLTTSRRGIDAEVVVPPNQVALFEVVTCSNGVVTPVPGLAVIQVNADPQPWTGKFLWADDPDDLDGFTALPRWSFGLIHNGDRLMQTGLGVPVPAAGYAGFLTLSSELKPDDEVVHGLSGPASGGPAYGLRVRTKTIQPQPGVRHRGTSFGTNWLEQAQSAATPAKQ